MFISTLIGNYRLPIAIFQVQGFRGRPVFPVLLMPTNSYLLTLVRTSLLTAGWFLSNLLSCYTTITVYQPEEVKFHNLHSYGCETELRLELRNCFSIPYFCLPAPSLTLVAQQLETPNQASPTLPMRTTRHDTSPCARPNNTLFPMRHVGA